MTRRRVLLDEAAKARAAEAMRIDLMGIGVHLTPAGACRLARVALDAILREPCAGCGLIVDDSGLHCAACLAPMHPLLSCADRHRCAGQQEGEGGDG